MQIGDATKYQAYQSSVKPQEKKLDADAMFTKNGLAEKAKEEIKNGELSAKTLSNTYFLEFTIKAESYASGSAAAQSEIFDIGKVKSMLQELDLSGLGYEGKPLAELSTEEAKGLIAEDGFFGVAKTSERLADFVLSGGGDDIGMLKAGREGIIRGFNEAEALWGGKLPDISYETLDKALAKIDQKIESLDGKIVDLQA